MERGIFEIVDTESLVPEGHLLRKIDEAVDFNKIYDMVEPLYCADNGRPSVDPVVLFKMVLIQHLYGLCSLRRTAEEVSFNVAYRWFLGYRLQEDTPHFSTISYNFRHRFTSETVDQIFNWILMEMVEAGYVAPGVVFVDGTHIKANANTKKVVKKEVPVAAKRYAEELMEEFPERTVYVVDSLGASFGPGLLACRAADLRNEGKTATEAGKILDKEVMHLLQIFTVDDLNFLKRTGRVSGATAAIGTILHIKPLLWGDPTGHIVALSKCRGRKKAIEAILEIYRTRAIDAQNQRVAISHGDCLEEAQQLAERVCEICKPKELIICQHEPFTGSHVGPGMLALYFFGDER